MRTRNPNRTMAAPLFLRRARPFHIAALVTVTVMLAAMPVRADDAINQVLQNNSAEWSDGFDPAAAGSDIRSTTPILSAQIVGAVQQAIVKYSDIVARGGWPVVPSNQKLRLGVRSGAVAILRQRLAISGDMDQ